MPATTPTGTYPLQVAGAPQLRKTPPRSYFLIMAWIAVFAAIGGFATTFIIPMANGSFKAPFVVHLHGFFAFGWILFFLVQTLLIGKKNYRLHRKLGWVGILIALGAAVTMFPVGIYSVEKELARGGGEPSYSLILGIYTTSILFIALVAAAIAYRKKGAVHKRLLLLATIVFLWPAWFRFRHYFPGVQRPEIWFGWVLADSLILLSWAFDRARYGKLFRVSLVIGTLIILEQAWEVFSFNSPAWQATGKFLYHIWK